jgi:hypothetical protein
MIQEQTIDSGAWGIQEKNKMVFFAGKRQIVEIWLA